jgi:hypothetical protein
MSVGVKKLERIKVFPKGASLLPTDFIDFGSSEAVRLSLFILEKQGVISRVAQDTSF